MADTPHFAYPFERGSNGKVKIVEQDDPEHVLACENVIVRCPVGFRVERPDFGIPWPDYRQVVDPDEMAAAMRQFEPRSELTGTEVRNLLDASESNVTIEVET